MHYVQVKSHTDFAVPSFLATQAQVIIHLNDSTKELFNLSCKSKYNSGGKAKTLDLSSLITNTCLFFPVALEHGYLF